MIQPRDYQLAGIRYFHERWDAGQRCVPAVLATGLGKSVIFSWPLLLDRFLNAGQRVLLVAHTDELCDQALKHMRRANPGRTVGLVKAGMNQAAAQIIVSSRQTLVSEARRAAIRDVGLIIIDEAHHAAPGTTYEKIIGHWPAARVAGLTATLARADRKKLSAIWGEHRPFARDILFGIRHGYLLDVVGKRVIVDGLDMKNVRLSAGDFRGTDMAEELERTFAPEVVAKAYLEHARGANGQLRKGIAFWPLVETAEHGADAFNTAGIRSEVIHGDIRTLPKRERRALLRRLHTGETTVVHGVAVLTEGFDEPTVDVVVIARPTRSAPLYQQMVGRVLRPNLELPPAQREKALVLDVVGAGANHDLRSLVDLAPERPLRRDDDGEFSLLELEEEWLKEEAGERAAGSGFDFEGAEDYAGDTAVVDFDPVGRAQLWARTPVGVWFMGAGTAAYAFLVESLNGDPGTYDVVLCSKSRPVPADAWMGQSWVRPTEYTELPIEQALAYGEDAALEEGGFGTKTLTKRKATWRKAEPTIKALNHARRLGLVIPEGHDAGQVAEMIDMEYARRRIDPLVQSVRAAVDSSTSQ